MKDAKLEESIGNKNGFILSQRSSEAAKALQKYPLQFVMEYGLITQIRPSLKERQKDILNIKRGILSSLQIKWSKTREKPEVIELMYSKALAKRPNIACQKFEICLLNTMFYRFGTSKSMSNIFYLIQTLHVFEIVKALLNKF